MTSGTMSGDRRWAAARRGGMTVLGKVAVPKPINLPSQRLENHGLDPNVEIVPKGTLSWGNRPSSAGSSAWGSSALSPSTDSSSASSSHPLGRPSSGSGTRPSTAGSDRALDSTTNAWGSKSRPSSASGVLNHTSLASLRPRSAETRPGSSQLSRFAEPLPANSGAWRMNAASEELGAGPSINDGFSLSSGDFPTLGSDKDECRKNKELQDCGSQGRPVSTDDRVSMAPDRRGTTAHDADVHGNPLRKDTPQFVDDGPRPGMETWHGDPHPYQNPNIPPQHFESWRGSPVNHPGGVWYRGPPAVPAHAAPVAPGAFPMEPFPYYRAQVQAPSLPNPQPVPAPGSGPHGHHPNSNLPRPHMPESYMRPGMPIRPGFYPGPVRYDGYYGPPMGFCGPSERDLAYMGMAAGPPAYNRYPSSNVTDPTNLHRGPSEDSGHPHDRGHYQAQVNQNDERDQDRREEKWTHEAMPSQEKENFSKSSVPEKAWGDDFGKDEDTYHGKRISREEASSLSFNDGVSNSANVKSRKDISIVDRADVLSVAENVGSSRDHSLIQKIEGLNVKARGHDSLSGFQREEPHNRVQFFNADTGHLTNETDPNIVLERHYPTGVLVPVPRDIGVSTGDRVREPAVVSVTAVHRRATHGPQGRGDYHGKGGLSNQEADGWRKKSAIADSHGAFSAVSSASTANVQLQEQHENVQQIEVPKANAEEKYEGGSVMTDFDSDDTQRAKMRERAKQRAMQRQKEEEERIQEQKAKALAKLEELNRRSANPNVEGSTEKSETVASNDAIPHKQEESQTGPQLSSYTNQTEDSSTVLSSDITQKNERSATKITGPIVSPRNHGSETKKHSVGEGIRAHDASRNAPQVCEASKPKLTGYKQAQGVHVENSSSKSSVSTYDHTDRASQEDAVSQPDSKIQTTETPATADSSVHPRKKHSKNLKNKHKVESPSVVSPPITPTELDPAKTTAEGEKPNVSESKLDLTSGQSSADAKDSKQSLENHSSVPREDVHGRANNTWKQPQNPRKLPRNPQVNRPDKVHSNDAVVWAPVRSQNKTEVTDQTTQKAAEGAVPKGDNFNKNSSKSKRAEMERYVPKAVAKELSQHGSIQQSASPSADQTASDGNEKFKANDQESDSTGKVVSVPESKNVDSKHRQTRGRESWRQRISSESATEPEQKLKPLESSDEGRSSESPPVHDGWNDLDDSAPLPPTSVGVKDHRTSGRGKRHSFRGKNSNSGETASQWPATDASQIEEASVKENRVVGDRSTSHWQPKSQAHVAHRSHGGQNVPEDSKNTKRDASRDGDLIPPQNLEHQETERERKSASPRRHSHSPSEGPISEVERAPPRTFKGRNNHHFSSRYRNNGNRGLPQDNKHQHYAPVNRERQRQNPHFEYQPVSPNNINKSNSEGRGDNMHEVPRFRERGRNHHQRGGRGHTYDRRGGSSRMDNSYE